MIPTKVITLAEDDHVRRRSTGAERGLWGAEDDHAKRHGAEQRFSKRFTRTPGISPGRCWPPGPFTCS